jgi:hypothetical protein
MNTYNSIDEIQEIELSYIIEDLKRSISDFERPGNKFINYLVDKTHNDSINCLLTRTR